MKETCMKCGTPTKNLVYIREWRKKECHWVCERCSRVHDRQHPELTVPFEITKHNKRLQ